LLTQQAKHYSGFGGAASSVWTAMKKISQPSAAEKRPTTKENHGNEH